VMGKKGMFTMPLLETQENHQKVVMRTKGRTQNRTGISGIRIRRDNRYTIQPMKLLFCISGQWNACLRLLGRESWTALVTHRFHDPGSLHFSIIFLTTPANIKRV
jgi:hypothetical protein